MVFQMKEQKQVIGIVNILLEILFLEDVAGYYIFCYPQERFSTTTVSLIANDDIELAKVFVKQIHNFRNTNPQAYELYL